MEKGGERKRRGKGREGKWRVWEGRKMGKRGRERGRGGKGAPADFRYSLRYVQPSPNARFKWPLGSEGSTT